MSPDRVRFIVGLVLPPGDDLIRHVETISIQKTSRLYRYQYRLVYLNTYIYLCTYIQCCQQYLLDVLVIPIPICSNTIQWKYSIFKPEIFCRMFCNFMWCSHEETIQRTVRRVNSTLVESLTVFGLQAMLYIIDFNAAIIKSHVCYCYMV